MEKVKRCRCRSSKIDYKDDLSYFFVLCFHLYWIIKIWPEVFLVKQLS